MARSLIFAIDGHQSADPEIAEKHNYKKGYIVQSVPDGDELGLKIVSKIGSKYILIDTPGVTPTQVETYEQPYIRTVDYTVVAQDTSIDGYRVDVFSTNQTTSGKGQITQAQIQSYLTDWNCTIVNVNSTRVRFDFLVYEVSISSAIWGAPPAIFSEDLYVSATGVHTIRATYTVAPVSQQFMTKAESRVIELGGTVILSTPGEIVFEIDRTTVLNKLKSELKNVLEEKFLSRRYYFDHAEIDNILLGGGYATKTKAEAISFMHDLALE